MNARLTNNVLVPAWILSFGLVFPKLPALGLTASLAVFALGILAIPAFMIFAAPKPALAPIAP